MKSILISILITTIGFSQSGNINYKYSQQYQVDMKKSKKTNIVRIKRDYLLKLNNIESCLLSAEKEYELKECEKQIFKLYHQVKIREKRERKKSVGHML